MASITIKGVNSLTQKLNNIAKMELKDTMNKATALVQSQAKELAPTGDSGGAGLKGSIKMKVRETKDGYEGRVFTNKEYAMYVEFGTGIKGDGTYPHDIKGLTLTYKSKPWYIPADEIDPKTAEKYHFRLVHGKDMDFYICYGQEAQPYMYPALKNNEKVIKAMFKEGVVTKLQANCKGGK
jgi:HK97 gp10 family phage protein